MSERDPLTASLRRTLFMHEIAELIEHARETGTIYAHPEIVGVLRARADVVASLRTLKIRLCEDPTLEPGTLAVERAGRGSRR